jgi:AcrR family transcriptional regulator
MGIAERRAREKDEMRQKIMSAAVGLILEEGYASFTMRKIADRIEYAASTIYLHFKNKSDLLEAICVEAFENLIECLDEVEKRNLSPLDHLIAGARAYIFFGLEHPNEYRLVFGNPTPDEYSQNMPESSQLGVRALEYLSHCLDRCRAACVLPAGDSSRDATIVWMQLHGLTSILNNEHGKWGLPWPTKEETIDRGIEIIVRGLGARL